MGATLSMDQFDRLESLLTNLRDEFGESRIESAVQSQRLGQIEKHLERLNGRTAKAEDALSRLDKIVEAAINHGRGAWWAIAGISSTLATVAPMIAKRLLP